MRGRGDMEKIMGSLAAVLFALGFFREGMDPVQWVMFWAFVAIPVTALAMIGFVIVVSIRERA
jgi:hypothetical protein